MGFSTSAGEDYEPLIDGARVTFQPGEFSKTITVNTLTDIPAEGDEVFNGGLFTSTDGVDVFNPQAQVTIREDGKIPVLSNLNSLCWSSSSEG